VTHLLLLANAVVLLACVVQASVGLGFAMIAVPMLVLIDSNYAPGPSLFVMMFLSAAMVTEGRKDIDFHGFRALLPGLLAGTVAGAIAARAISPALFEVVFGSLVLTALVVGRTHYSPPTSPVVLGAGGFAAGLMGTVSGMHGPPLAIVYRHSEPAQARATIALVLVIAGLQSLVSLHFVGRFGVYEVLAGLWLLPGLIVGYGLSILARNRIPEGVARTLMILIAATSGMILLGRRFF
jgi:uncharacterized membrane protein YfcA